MNPQSHWLWQALLLWGLLIPLAAYFLQMASNLCGADMPSFRKAMLVTVFVAAAGFFTYDGVGYGIMKGTLDVTHLPVPPDYSYAQWLGEPLYLKWQALGAIPVLRYLPLVFAFCLMASLYTLILRIEFRVSAVIFLVQWTLNIVALAVLTFVLNQVFGLLNAPAPTPAGPQMPPIMAQRQPWVAPQQRAMTRPGQRPMSKPGYQPPPAAPTQPAPPGQSSLGSALANYHAEASPSLASARDTIGSLRQRLDPYLDRVKEASAPYTRYLPPAVQEFLDDGGWWLVLALLAVVVFFWLRFVYRRLRKGLFGRKKRKKAKKGPPLREDLLLISDAFTDPGPKQATVRTHPVRLRLLVLAPASSYVGDLLPDMAENLVDYVVPGLGEILEYDHPGVRVWPRQSSEKQFMQLFFDMLKIPEAIGRASSWVLLAGTIRLGRQKVHLGLATFADRASHMRQIRVEKEKWQEVLGLQEVTEPV